MKVLGYVCYVIAGGLGIYLVIQAFDTWISIWGIAGVFFGIFLFPLAVLAFPLGRWVYTGDVIFLLDYIDFAIAGGILFLGAWLIGKAEHREYLQSVGSLPEKKRFPGVLWVLPLIFGILGGVVAALISGLKYGASWWELLLSGFIISFLWAIITALI